jgi:hypothetical protein
MGISEFWQQVVNGLIIIVVVALDQWRRRAARVGTPAPAGAGVSAGAGGERGGGDG